MHRSSADLELEARVDEEGWPCQRLRLAYASILFFFFEVMIGRHLPGAMPILALGIGIACLVSAMQAIREWQLQARLGLITGVRTRTPSASP